MNLKGFRTKISGFFAGLPVGVGTILAQFDPDLVMQIVSSHPVPLACYQGLTFLANWYYRDQAPTVSHEAADLAAKAASDDTELIAAVEPLLKPQTNLELELVDEINGDFDHVENT